jgi:pimeloyl-ACP methyl ester carboxylesterase
VTEAEIAAEYVDVRNIRIWLASSGEGPPLVYLPGADPEGDDPALALLSQDFRVYRPHHPGFGRSDEDPAVDSVLDVAFRYLDLLDVLGLDRVYLAGLSLGGWIAAQVAVLAPDRIAKLVLACPAGLRPPVPVPDMFTLDPAELAMMIHHQPEVRRAAVAAVSEMPADADRFTRYLRSRAATAHLGWNPYMHDPKLAGRLHRVGCEVLIIWGAQDRLLPPECALAWQQALSRARLELVENAGHRPQAEQPAVFAALVRKFLS